MSTLSEQILEPLVQEVVRRVLDEFNKRADLVPNVHERLTNIVYDLAELRRRIDKVEAMDIDYKIERAIGECDFDDAIKEAVYERIDNELENKGFIDEEDLQRYLDQYRFVTEGSLIEFLNDRVRTTVE